MVAYLDVSSAYDNVYYDVMIQRLDEVQCPIRMRNFIATWMKERNVEFIIDGDNSISRKVGKGLPQGAVLSPNLYSIYTADIMKNVSEKTKKLQFADDIAIYCSTGKRSKNKKIIKKSILRIKSNLRKLGLDLETSKTECVEYRYKELKNSKEPE